MVRTSGVYIIRNLKNGKSYIGSSVNMHKRWQAHRQRARKGTHHSVLFQRAWDKYGEDSFLFDVVEEVEPVSERLEYNEQNAIWLFRPAYNISPIAGRVPPMSEESKRKLSEKMSGVNNFFYGKKRPDHSIKMSGANNYNFGAKYNDERLIQMSLYKFRLTSVQVGDAVKMFKSGSTKAAIAKHFLVSQGCIIRLLNNKIKAYPNIT